MSDKPIGRSVWVTIRGDVDRGSAIEDALVDAVVDLGIRHAVKVGYTSGPLYEDGNEVDRKLARYKDALTAISELIEPESAIFVAEAERIASEALGIVDG